MDQQTEALLARAAALRRAGQVEPAIGAYRELLERAPELADSWYNLGWLQKQARQFEAALASYAEALERGVRDPEEVHVNRAVILSDHLGRHDEAQAELEAALELNANYVPALLNLGNLHEDRGNRPAAEEAYRSALELAPDSALALSRLAGVIAPASAATAEVVALLRNAIERARPPGERADLGFALGRLLDSAGDYPAAFAAYAAANAASRESFGSAARYDRAAQEAFVDSCIGTFEAPPAVEADQSPAIFIVGMFRSGSTLVEQILAGHSLIDPGGELDLIPALAARIPDYPAGVTAADFATLDAWRAFYRHGVAPLRRAGKLLSDKRPDNFLHVGLIKTLFPNAKIIHTRRNRLDNILSLHFLHLDPRMAYALDLADADHWYGEHDRLMAHWKALYRDDLIEVDYDELVRDPEPLLRNLIGELGLEWEDGLLDFHGREGAVKTASVWQVREPLHARSSGRWRNYEEQLSESLRR